jgi:hypothetical protein
MTQNTLEELKVTYRVLHRNLTDYPDLMDSSFLDDLQHHLQSLARAQGIDTTDHGQWDAWLGNEVFACSTRMEQRLATTISKT